MGAERLRPRIPLTHREFARKYIVMPSGPHVGESYRDEWQPVIGLLWDELDLNYWWEVVVTGPVQASKSFGALVVPTLRDVHELRFEPIVAVPEADMFADKWDKDFKTVLRASPALEHLLPQTGSGSKEGRAKDRVTLGNGIDIKVMSGGGKATNKAGYSTPRLRITEAAGFSGGSSSEKDNEADKYRQLLGRLGSFKRTDPRRLVMIEGTLTVEEELPQRLRGNDDDEALISTRSRIVSPCPHCREWISPEREHLVGWKEAKNVEEVYANAHFVCPSCGVAISDAERCASMQQCQLLHWGQEITPDGEIVGALPPTRRLWFRWSAWHNLLLDAADTAFKEWEAAQIAEGTEDRENAERDLCQKSWAIPYVSKLSDAEPLRPDKIKHRRESWKRNVCPPDTVKVTVGCDCGKKRCHWVAIAGRANGSVHVVAYGWFDVCTSDLDDVESKLKAALQSIIDDTFEAGFLQAAAAAASGSVETYSSRMIDSVWIDRGWMKDVVCDVVRPLGSSRDNRYRAAKGFGKSTRDKLSYNSPPKRSKNRPWMGNRWYGEVDLTDRIVKFNFDADYYKRRVHEWFRVKPGIKGSITLYAPEVSSEHDVLLQHVCNEQYVTKWEPGKGFVSSWDKRGANHLLDSLAEAAAALDYVGFRMADAPNPDPEPEPEDPHPPASKPAKKPQGNWYAAALGRAA